MSVLVVDDEDLIINSLKHLFRDENIEIIGAENGKEGLAKLKCMQPKTIVTDYRMPEMNGLEFIKASKALFPNIPVIVLTAANDKETSIQFLKEGAYRYLEKPFDSEELKLTVKQAIARYLILTENENLHKILNINDSNQQMCCKSDNMKNCIKMIGKVANTSATVLLLGESGTGKSMIARHIHENSERAQYPFVEFNCASFNESLIENELFGHEKGAFTGAESLKVGRFELANKGTIFLDEIGELSLAMQVKLLRALYENTFERVGGTTTITTDVRVITATNQNLNKMVADCKFREDLYFRINEFPITIPPLRERKADIAILATSFLDTLKAKYNKKDITGFSKEALSLMRNYSWKGNVRELKNVISRAAIMCMDPVISEEFISQFLLMRKQDNISNKHINNALDKQLSENELVQLYAKEIYKSTGYSKKETAKVLNINYRTLMTRLED
jgi:two-component system, NtrC family, response regulator AtoC